MNISSKLIESAVNEFARLPGIGKKTALRLVLHLLKKTPDEVSYFSDTISRMRSEIQFCNRCHNVSDHSICSICDSHRRDPQIICVVENIRDLMAIESTNSFQGTYHVLGGVISPMDGIGPEDLEIASLEKRVEEFEVQELIMAMSPTMEGDTTIFYLTRMFKEKPVQITAISRGISFGGELEYTDELTLARSIHNRLPFDKYLSQK